MTGIGALDNTKVAMERENVLMKKRSAGMYKLWLKIRNNIVLGELSH